MWLFLAIGGSYVAIGCACFVWGCCTARAPDWYSPGFAAGWRAAKRGLRYHELPSEIRAEIDAGRDPSWTSYHVNGSDAEPQVQRRVVREAGADRWNGGGNGRN